MGWRGEGQNNATGKWRKNRRNGQTIMNFNVHVKCCCSICCPTCRRNRAGSKFPTVDDVSTSSRFVVLLGRRGFAGQIDKFDKKFQPSSERPLCTCVCLPFQRFGTVGLRHERKSAFSILHVPSAFCPTEEEGSRVMLCGEVDSLFWLAYLAACGRSGGGTGISRSLFAIKAWRNGAAVDHNKHS